MTSKYIFSFGSFCNRIVLLQWSLQCITRSFSGQGATRKIILFVTPHKCITICPDQLTLIPYFKTLNSWDLAVLITKIKSTRKKSESPRFLPIIIIMHINPQNHCSNCCCRHNWVTFCGDDNGLDSRLLYPLDLHIYIR